MPPKKMSNQTPKNLFIPNKQTTNDPKLLPNIHIKLLAFDLNSLTQTQTRNNNTFYRKGVPISRVEVFGIVVKRDFKPDKLLRFIIDDGTGCINCIMWCNHLTSPFMARRSTSDVRSIAQMTNVYSDRVQLGFNVRVRGRLSVYQGVTRVTVDTVVVEKDPNFQIMHWLDCIKLARKCYDVAPNN